MKEQMTIDQLFSMIHAISTSDFFVVGLSLLGPPLVILAIIRIIDSFNRKPSRRY